MTGRTDRSRGEAAAGALRSVEVKDISLPESMRRSMSAEAEPERRARVISADGEFQASTKLSEAASAMSETPSAV